MKDYPSIPRSYEKLSGVYVFDKLDGSNIRAEWTRKRGFEKFGTRTRLLDRTDLVFGSVPDVFKETLDEKLSKMAVDNRWESVIVFMEFHGPNSFAGQHEQTDKKTLTVFDVAPYKKGILGPKDFLKLSEKYGFEMPAFLGQHNWSSEFLKKVLDGELEGVTFEGVVGKIGESHKLKLMKAKTQAWIDKVMKVHGRVNGTKLVNS